MKKYFMVLVAILATSLFSQEKIFLENGDGEITISRYIYNVKAKKINLDYIKAVLGVEKPYIEYQLKDVPSGTYYLVIKIDGKKKAFKITHIRGGE